MEEAWRGPVYQRLHLPGWADGIRGIGKSNFRGKAHLPSAGEGSKLMARWKRKNKAGKYGRTHIRSELTLYK